MLAVLDHPGAIQHPRLRLDHRAHPLGHRTIDDRRLPRTVGQEVLQRLILRARAAEPVDDRLKRLARARLDQPADVHLSVAALPNMPQPRGHIGDIRRQALHNLRRNTHDLAIIIIDPALDGDRGNHATPVRRRSPTSSPIQQSTTKDDEITRRGDGTRSRRHAIHVLGDLSS